MPALKILRGFRERIRAVAESTPDEIAFAIPEGFTNNIAWNIGHVLVTQQILCYRLSGQPLAVDEETCRMFQKGSSPADWSVRPDLKALAPRLTELAEAFERDYRAGVFSEFQPYTTSAGIELSSIDEAVAFNNVHEGLHLGYMMAMRRVVDSSR